MITADTISNIYRYKQEHLLTGCDRLSANDREKYEKQLNQLDFSLLDRLDRFRSKEVEARGKIEPLGAMQLSDIEKNKEKYHKIGVEAIVQGKVGAVLLAGGQGTRLGFDKPKGMFDVGVNRTVYIFQRLIENLLDVVNETGAFVPLMIMTSEKNHEDTIQFFENNNYFGYDKDSVVFFTQNMAPCVDFAGKILKESEDRLALSPNGNGGWFSSLKKSGIMDAMKKNGVEWLNVFSVDNVLQRIADPTFIGATISSGCVSGSKVVRKASPDERVGVMCNEDGRPSIVEYYELTGEMRDAVDENGEPAYNYGVILNYLFRVKELEEIMDNEMPVHIVEKKIPYLDEHGNLVNPEKVNGYKFEELILDMIHMLDSCLPYEVVRSKEFAPVKNKTGVDSVETARELLALNGIDI